MLEVLFDSKNPLPLETKTLIMPTLICPFMRMAQYCFVLIALLFFNGTHAQVPSDASNYPNQPVKLVVPYPPGGGADFLARLLAEKAQSKWGQTVIVENRSGAGGNVDHRLPIERKAEA